ncbi:unnamed protein product [Acanthoscelides obtectus]|uniref:Uncharacterized protein n=1 Tax=Acanthoscelides obtectus TaxID=200917 RepID=A0A9P0JPI0_ACAOB|nr:unnamed protein product [Acanthoscelides obtectus]CAH1958727.1 unnamed protein product [Acanthoscelides obtectus]CAK1679141.1 hypothetical protein AOBTE_LOCUS32143 [Acanthoscelides obtectus]CAK1679143.1 hypothetical protein AOBTE_LOCUS32144 [Acanthoscelides obtectus]
MSYFSRKEQNLNISVTILSLNWRGITEDLKQRLIILQTICCNSMLSTGVRNIE